MTEAPDQYNLQGVQLCGASQATLYKAIRTRKPKPDRMKFTIMLDITRHAISEMTGNTPSDKQIWLSIRDKDITRKISDFMWKSLQQAYKCGHHWRNIPGYGQRAICAHCNVDETMEHITG
ncbi:hypothetical protein C8R44DRAFT_616098 [Mycena epipterygia]|nr:hypothetical protein C8R44DRAFT_616098 [Mycena epipterygia]